MKLVTRVSLTAAVLFLLATQFLSGFLLYDTWKGNYQAVAEAEQQKFENAADNFIYRARSSQMENYGSLTREAVVRQLFRDTAIGNMALYQEGEELYNQGSYGFGVAEGLNPEAEEGKTESIMERRTIGDEQLIVFVQAAEIADEVYEIYYYKDISYLWEQLRSSAIRFFLLSFIAAIGLLGILIIMEKRVLKPIYKLRDGAREIGKGNYTGRIPIKRHDEVGEIAESFNEMAEQVQKHMEILQQANETQKQMLGSLGHELRTPMTSIIGYADTLLGVKLTQKQKEKALFYIRHECRRLSRLSQKLLELNGLSEASSIERETPLSMSLFSRIEESAQEIVSKDGKLFSMEVIREPEPVLVDADLIESLVLNLIDNSRKASIEGQRIQLQIDGNQFTVSDNGKGIPQDELERVTKAFYMVDKARAKQQGGVGLGLALCQQIVLLHQARMEIASTFGEGTSVTVVFPEV